MKKKIVVLLLAAMAMSLSASAELLLYEPFAYQGATLNGNGGALGTTGVWNSYAVNDPTGWQVYQEGTLSGQVLYDGVTPVTFDGTVSNLQTTGGYAGHGAPGYKLSADIAIDPAVTASFQGGTTTWLSYVSVMSFDRNSEQPNLTLGTIAAPDGARGDNYGGIGTGGSGFGTGGGPMRNNRTDIYPMFYLDGQYKNITGDVAGNSYRDSASEVLDADCLPWVPSDDDGFGAANIVVVKLQWDAGPNGEDIISLARFLETDEISESAFDAMITAQPGLSSINWAAENQPSLDQSQLDTITFAGIKYFVDEIRLGTTFDDVTPVPEPATIAILGLGGLGLLRRRKA